MSRPLKNITLNEGFNDLGTQQIEVTEFEFPVIEALNAANDNAPQPSWNALFKADYSNGDPLPVGSKVQYNVYIKSPDIEYPSELYTTLESAFSIPVPQFPFVHRADDNVFYVDIRIEGEYTARNEEIFLEVNDPEDNTRYTPFTNLVTDDSGVLGVKSSVGDFYDLAQNITIDPGYGTLVVGSDGTIYCFDDATETWTELVQLTFVQFEDPSALIFITDGIYEYDAGAGTISTGNLEETSTGFESFSAAIPNPEPGYVSIDIDIFGLDPVSPIYSDTFNKVMPGSQNFNLIEIAGSPASAPDESPDLDAIETVSGVTFTTVFKDFLENNNYDTLNAIRKAGPIMYIKNFPAEGWSPTEVALLQSHVDLFTINPDINENQHLIDNSFGTLYEISTQPLDVFISGVTTGSIGTMKLTQIHETARHTQSLTSNVLSSYMMDTRLTDGVFPVNDDSNFADEAFSSFTNKCECDDCTSAVSPFSYLVDLLKYGAKHIKKSTTAEGTYNPTNYSNFISLLETYFFQPFGTLSVSCDTLHDEYCRVRLVTEVLEKYVDTLTLPSAVEAQLNADREKYLLLTYRTLLSEAGTSYEQLRDVVATQPNDDKITAATGLTRNIGIPLYISGTSDFTVDRMWLTFGNSNPDQVLNGENLEEVFGFRDTQRNVHTATPDSLMEQWRNQYLRNQWKAKDYPFTDYSRENVIPENSGTFKDNWLPIIDPDIVGRNDMAYLPTTFIVDLWEHRKSDTDTFLDFIIHDSSVQSRTSADLKTKVLKVKDLDISTDEIVSNNIYIQDPNTSTYEAFEVYSKALNGLNTDIILSKPTTQALFQPEGASPTMRYDKLVNLPFDKNPSASASITLEWDENVITDPYTSTPYAKIYSDNSPDVYSTNPTGGEIAITAVSFNTESEVDLDLASALTTDFIQGNITFIYKSEVPLVTDTIVDPEKVATELFDNQQSYSYLSPYAPTGSSYSYDVWDTPPSGWYGLDPGGNTYFENLKALYKKIESNTADEDQKGIVTDNLHMSQSEFQKMMDILYSCENYLGNTYSVDKPDETTLYNLASIFRVSGKKQLQETWVKEEIDYEDPVSSGNYEKLMLSSQYFWKSLDNPQNESWGPSLQTVPDDTLDIGPNDIPILDPEILSEEELLNRPDAAIYRTLYFVRKQALEDKLDTYFDLIVANNDDAYMQMLNDINTGSTGTDFDLTPQYTGSDSAEQLAKLIDDFESNDAFKKKKATDKLESAFGFTAEEFETFLPIKEAYENENGTNIPSNAELKKACKICVTGHKRIQLYPYYNGSVQDGWIKEEVTGSETNSISVKYYNVRKLRLAPFRGNNNNRRSWQNTLEDWNIDIRVNPDICPPENIKTFISGNTEHDLWVDRKGALDTLQTTLEGLFNAQEADADVFDALKDRINMAMARTDDTSINSSGHDYLPYFLGLKDIEETGEDIRPMLNQWDIDIKAYRALRNIYDILDNAVTNSTPSNLTDDEYNDIVNILISIHTATVLAFTHKQEEFNQDVLLCEDEFQIFEPSPVEFPGTLLEEKNTWRAPHELIKEWEETYETRKDRNANVIETWETVLLDTEEISMPSMRDALITALKGNCETFEEAAERLAETFFIETKDNCCVKHSRVSFALETLQGFIFALEKGVYNDYVDSFSLHAPNFDEEWEWLGSYATWRSAVFTFIFPENLLYPTLKRLQSPKFYEISKTISNANRLAPDQACDLGKEYQEYLNDILNLEMICTADSRAKVKLSGDDDCCDDAVYSMENTTFYFAKSNVSTKHYWARSLQSQGTYGKMSFWEELPIDENATLISCQPISYETENLTAQGNGFEEDLSLWLFYTYVSDGKLKMFYKTKSLKEASSTWSDENEIEFPEEDIVKIYQVIPIQSFYSWDYPSFFLKLAYTNHFDQNTGITIDGGPVYSLEVFIPKNKGFEPAFHKDIVTMGAVQSGFNEIRKNSSHYLKIFFNNSSLTNGVSIISNRGIITIFDDQYDLKHYNNTYFAKVLGAFHNRNATNEIIIYGIDGFGNKKAITATYTLNSISTNNVDYDLDFNAITIGSDFINTDEVYPRYRMKPWLNGIAYQAYSTKALVSTEIIRYDTEIKVQNPFGLAPLELGVPIASSECITDMKQRKANIKDLFKVNFDFPGSNFIGNYYVTPEIKEYIYEAYYHLPMLIALDQQSRSQYDAALDWYRSVYDYTLDNTNMRKIFYGLVTEESLTNVYSRPQDWLLDPLNPHLIAETRNNAYTKYTVTNIIQCLIAYADQEFTMDTVETVPRARKLYSEALQLLKVKALRTKPSRCYEIVEGCMDVVIDDADKAEWNNSLSKLKRELLGINNIDDLDTITTQVETIFGNGSLSMEEKFTDSFDYIDNNKPTPPTPDSTDDLITGEAERNDNVFRFLFSDIDLSGFNNGVQDTVAGSVARISSRDVSYVEDPANANTIDWLEGADPANGDEYDFTYLEDDGTQRLPEGHTYNPFDRTQTGYTDNMDYSNALPVYHVRTPIRPFPFIIDYAFCMPQNPVYESLQLKANMELYKIHNCRNIAGMVRELDIYSAPTDGTTGVPFIGANGNLVLPGLNNFTPSQYRFRVLIERAKQLVSQAQQLESQFLSALEKEDAENYSQLRAQQDLETSRATVRLQDLRVRKANNEKVVAETQLSKTTFVKNTYDNRLAQGLNPLEKASLNLMQTSAVLQSIAAVNTATLGASLIAMQKYVEGASTINSSISATAQVLSTQANVLQQMASYQRRAEEWIFQSQLANFDIQIANQQIKIAEDNIRIVSQERKIAEMNVGHAEDTLEFLKTKFTNAELYRWMGNVLERAYSYMLSLATSVAKTAESQYYFEQQEPAGQFIQNDYWETKDSGPPSINGNESVDRRGLTGSARLLQDITRLDQHAFETTKRKLQMTKTISLGQNFPSEFQTFKETGVLGFELTNTMFDYDFPGQYLRLIKGVKVTVVGLTPVYDGIKATLTSGTTSYTVIESNYRFQKVPIRRLELDRIALSSPAKDDGLFEMQPMQGELLNPFEGMGIESRWEFKMPPFSNRMDFSQIADVIIEVDYTAFESDQYRYQVLQELDNTYKFSRGFSVKNDFPDAWYSLSNVQQGSPYFDIVLELDRSMFPNGVQNIRLDGSDPIFQFVRADGFTDTFSVLQVDLVENGSAAENSGASLPPVNEDGILRISTLTGLDDNLYQKIKITFDNTAVNRVLFTEEKITDIMMILNCKADLPNYPV